MINDTLKFVRVRMSVSCKIVDSLTNVRASRAQLAKVTAFPRFIHVKQLRGIISKYVN